MRKQLIPLTSGKGANFKLKAKNVAGYRNYDSSEFAAQSALLDDDDAMEAIWKKQSSLQEFVAADQFKDYDALKTRLDYVLGNKGTPRFQDRETVEAEEDFRSSNRGTAPAVTSTPGDFNAEDIVASSSSNDDDDALSYFAKLAEE